MKLLRYAPHAVFVLLAAELAAQPIPAAIPEGILCAGTYVAIGRVLAATSADCRAGKSEACLPDNVVDLTVEMTEILGAREASPSYPVGRTLRRGDVIAVRVHAFSTLVVTSLPPPRPVLADWQIRDAFAGKELLFSVTLMDHHVAHHSAFPASLWPLSEVAWALDTMASDPADNCPKRR